MLNKFTHSNEHTFYSRNTRITTENPVFCVQCPQSNVTNYAMLNLIDNF